MRLTAICTTLCLLTLASATASAELLQPATASFAYRAAHDVNGSSIPIKSGVPMFPEKNPEGLVTAQFPDPADSADRNFSRRELCSTAASVAQANELPVPFFTNLIWQESGFKPRAVSPVGAQGIAQFMPRTAAAYGLENPFDPIHALAVSGKFLRELLGQFGNLGLAAAAYNAGPKRVGDWLARRGKLPAETRHYVHTITGRPADQWANARGAGGHRMPVKAPCVEAVEANAAAGPEPVFELASVPVRQTVRIAAAGTKHARSKHRAGNIVVAAKGERVLKFAGANAVIKSKSVIKLVAAQPAKNQAAGSRHAHKPTNRVQLAIMRPENTKSPHARGQHHAPVKVAAAKPATKLAAKVAAKAEASPKNAAKAAPGRGGSGKVKYAAAR
jgi:hypothetical protein